MIIINTAQPSGGRSSPYGTRDTGCNVPWNTTVNSGDDPVIKVRRIRGKHEGPL